jgi:Protein of unknown function (DUF1488)
MKLVLLQQSCGWVPGTNAIIFMGVVGAEAVIINVNEQALVDAADLKDPTPNDLISAAERLRPLIQSAAQRIYDSHRGSYRGMVSITSTDLHSVDE